jgi:hopanoid biosynthesis associated radical SAM protein HpnH
MPVPAAQMFTVASYLVRQKLAGRRRYPLVLMLEPLYRCNLACAGCGKIQYPANVLKAQLSFEDCMRAVDECPAPVVSIPGGEPLMHPEIDRIAAGLVARRKYVYLCTNALLLEEKLHLFTPSKYLSFSVHMDGLEEEHDRAVCREGTFRTAERAIRAALARGFRVTTNTTLYDGADPERVTAFFDAMMELGVEGMMVSPGYAYEKAPDQQHFLRSERTQTLFRQILSRPARRRWRFNQSPLFLEFLTGARRYDCTPWGNPTYSVFGWQKPCYLLQDGYAKTFRELLEDTPWERYGHASGNPHCRDCMVHSGFEASAVEEAFSSWRGLAAMARAFLFGPRVPAPGPGSAGASAGASAAAGREPARDLLPVLADSGAAACAAAPGRGWSSDATPAALRAAFAYRGDVTLQLEGGSQVVGFVASLNAHTLDLWHQGSSRVEQLPLARIRRVELSGRDPASGRSYQTWLRSSGDAETSAAAV